MMGGTDRTKNVAVARLFEEIALSLDLAGEQGHRPRAYRRAARGVAAHPESLQLLAAEGRLREVYGVGPSLAALIEEYLRTGGIRTHARLTAEHPPGLAPLLRARGFGPAKVHALHAALGVTDLDDIQQAAREGRLADMLGARRAAELVALLPELRRPRRDLRLKSAWELARQVRALLSQSAARPEHIEVVGAARRMCETVPRGIEFVAIPGRGDLLDAFASLPAVVEVVERSANHVCARLWEGAEAALYVTSRDAFGTAMVQHTG